MTRGMNVCVLSGRLTPEANCSKQAVSRDVAEIFRSCRHGSVTMGSLAVETGPRQLLFLHYKFVLLKFNCAPQKTLLWINCNMKNTCCERSPHTYCNYTHYPSSVGSYVQCYAAQKKSACIFILKQKHLFCVSAPGQIWVSCYGIICNNPCLDCHK